MSDTLDLAQMRLAADQAAALLRTLSNLDRLLLLCQLTQGERCVSELETLLDIRQPTLSQQLGVLRDQGLVVTRREGKRIFYRLSDPRAVAVLNLLYKLYCPRPNAAERS